MLLQNGGRVVHRSAARRVDKGCRGAIGPLADAADDMLGEWACQGKQNKNVTLRAALSERLGSKLLYAKGNRDCRRREGL